MKTTIFIRILAATLLPVLLLIIILTAAARNAIYQEGTLHARELTELSVRHISEQTSDKLADAVHLQSGIGREIAAVDFQEPGAKSVLNELLATLINTNQDLYATWFAFEPGVLPGNDGRYFRSLMRMDGNIEEIFDMSDEQLSNPEASPWYNIPLSTGHVYANISDYYDFGAGAGAEYTFTMTYPVKTADGRVIGCVGLDIRYEDLFPRSSITDDGMYRNMLISEDGLILFSSDEHNIGKTVYDVGFENKEVVAGALREEGIWQGEIDSPFSGEKEFLCLYSIEIAHSEQTICLYRAIPVGILYGSYYSSTQSIVAIGVVGMILLAFFVFFSTKGIAGNVRKITGSFNRVANESAEDALGGEHIPIFETNVIELEALQKALVKMMIELRHAHQLRLRAVETEAEKEKLMAAAEAKSYFFAAMSHEIRTPMNAVLGISEILLYEGGLSQDQERYVRDIKVSAESLLNIVDDILDITRLETGKMELRPEHYNFRTLMDNTASLATHLAKGSNLKFIYERDGEYPLCLYGDGARLRQILLNLIGNAVKFTRDGSVTLHVSIGAETLRFTIADTGIGIREEELGSIFEAYHRLDISSSRAVSGAGLGLPISKSLIELMGGSIYVESAYGKGSVFSVEIPLVMGDEEKMRRVDAGKRTQYSDSLRVLVVDDDTTNLNVSSGLLRAAHGIHCDTANSGHEAIEKTRETEYDIIFMDHMMPELDGVDTTQRIRELGGHNRDVPIIALTANAMIGTRKEMMDGGMNDFLTKPVQSGRLQEILDAWVPKDKRLTGASPGKSAAPAAKEKPECKALTDPLVSSLLERAGVDTMAGLENIGFDEGMYLHSLSLFRELLPDTVRQLEEALEKSSMKEIHIQVHSLKGSLASIGAAALSNDVQTLESAAAKGSLDDARALLPPYIKKLKDFHKALCQAIPGANIPTEHIPYDEERLNAHLQGLYAALEKYDYEAVTVGLEIIMSMNCGPVKSKAIARLKLLINSFDYPGAASLVQEMIMPR